MPEIAEGIRGFADTLKAKFTPPEYIPGCEVIDVTDKDYYTTDNGWVVATVGEHNAQRIRYRGFPANIQAPGASGTHYVDVEYFPSRRLYEVYGVGQGGTLTAGGINSVKISQLWESDGGTIAFEADAGGNLTLNGTRTLTIPTDLIHAGDADNKIGFTDDQQTFTVGGVVLLQLTQDTQNVVKIGDVAGGGDVDISINNATLFLRGSDGFLGLGGPTSPTVSTWILEVAGAGKRIAVGSYSVTTDNTAIPAIVMQKSHTATIGALVETIDGERLGDMLIQGVDSNNSFRATAGFRVTQNGAAGVGDVPAHMDLLAANNAVVLRLDSNKDVIVGDGSTPSAGGQLHVDQSDNAAAQPVLYLDQADVSEPLIEVNTTIGTGNTIEAVGAKALTVTHFLKWKIPGGLTRYSELGTIA